MSRYKNKLLKDGGAMQPCPEYTNSELNHFLALAVIFNKNYKEPRGRGGVFKKKKKKKKEGTFLQSCIRWCWEDNSIVIRERVQLAWVCLKQSHSHQTANVTVASLRIQHATRTVTHTCLVTREKQSYSVVKPLLVQLQNRYCISNRFCYTFSFFFFRQTMQR